MSLDLDVVTSMPHIVLLLTLSLVVIKGIIVYGLGRIFKFSHRSSRNMSFTLLQGGEFGFVLFSLSLNQGLLSSEVVSILNAAIILSMVLTPFLFAINQRLLISTSETSKKPYDEMHAEGAEVIVAGYGRVGQIVSRFLGAQNIKYIILEHSSSQVDIARKYKKKIYYGDASRVDILESLGAKDAKYLILAIGEIEKSLEVAKLVKKHFPHIKILARARNREHVFELMKLGITECYRETLLTSLEVAKAFLLHRGADEDCLNKKVAHFIKKDNEILIKQFELKENEEEMISFTHKANLDLETTLSLEINED